MDFGWCNLQKSNSQIEGLQVIICRKETLGLHGGLQKLAAKSHGCNGFPFFLPGRSQSPLGLWSRLSRNTSPRSVFITIEIHLVPLGTHKEPFSSFSSIVFHIFIHCFSYFFAMFVQFFALFFSAVWGRGPCSTSCWVAFQGWCGLRPEA